MSSLETAVIQVVYKAWQEIDVKTILRLLNQYGDNPSNTPYVYEDLEKIEIESYDVLVSTTDGKEHRLEDIIPEVVVETDQPERLELWNVSRFEHLSPVPLPLMRVQSISKGLRGSPVLDLTPR